MFIPYYEDSTNRNYNKLYILFKTNHHSLSRFKRKCANAGVLAEVRKREHYEKPSVKRKKKSEAARKRKFK